MSKKLLTVDKLRTYFYTSQGVVKAVDNVSIEVNKGESVGLIGESGCGKTATARSILRLVPSPGRIVEGSIFFEGRDLLKIPEKEFRQIRGKDVSAVFQDPMTFLNPTMKAGDQIAEAILTHVSMSRSEARLKTIETLETVLIPSPEKVVDYYPFQLSGGMRQRILIAIALACSPSLIIADEPTTALDVTVQIQILELLKKLRKEEAISTLLITHDLGIVAELCDRCYVMYAGKIVESADVFSLFGKPIHPYTQGLLRSILSIDEFKKELLAIEGVVPDLTDLPTGCRFHPRCSTKKGICERREPNLVEFEPGHQVSCWLEESEG